MGCFSVVSHAFGRKGIDVVFDFKRWPMAEECDDVKTKRSFELVLTHIIGGCIDEVGSFFMVHGLDSLGDGFAAACFRLHRHHFAEIVGDDVYLEMPQAPVARQEAVALFGQISAGLLFASAAQFVVLCHRVGA